MDEEEDAAEIRSAFKKLALKWSVVATTGFTQISPLTATLNMRSLVLDSLSESWFKLYLRLANYW